MGVDKGFYDYLDAAFTYPVYWGRISTTESAKEVINFFRISTAQDDMNPIRLITYQVSVRAGDLETVQGMAKTVCDILRGYTGTWDNIAVYVLGVEELGNLFEEDGQLYHIPIQCIVKVVD